MVGLCDKIGRQRANKELCEAPIKVEYAYKVEGGHNNVEQVTKCRLSIWDAHKDPTEGIAEQQAYNELQIQFKNIDISSN